MSDNKDWHILKISLTLLALSQTVFNNLFPLFSIDLTEVDMKPIVISLGSIFTFRMCADNKCNMVAFEYNFLIFVNLYNLKTVNNKKWF